MKYDPRNDVMEAAPTPRLTEEELAKKREEYAERAAIKEFEGNMSRDEAEMEAWLEVYGSKP
jgi:hypothetical protein